MLIHPQFDPEIFAIGRFSFRWYGFMYVLGFLQYLFFGKLMVAKKLIHPKITHEVVENFLIFLILGVLIGGRLGQILFYEASWFRFSFYLHNPLQIIAIWNGGMSFHGGFLGVLISFSLFLYFHNKNIPKNLQISWLELADLVAITTPLALAFGRFGNFINGELWGRVCDANLPWAMIFPRVDDLPRHPSQLYEVALEGILLSVIMWSFLLFFNKKNYQLKPGVFSAIFAIGYGCFRSITEFFREPDVGIFGYSYVISMGQWLSIPLILCGIFLLMKIYKK